MLAPVVQSDVFCSLCTCAGAGKGSDDPQISISNACIGGLELPRKSFSPYNYVLLRKLLQSVASSGP